MYLFIILLSFQNLLSDGIIFFIIMENKCILKIK